MAREVTGISLAAYINLTSIRPTAFSLFGINIPAAGWVRLDLIQFSSDFELNSIPKANMLIAVGRQANDVSKISAIHNIINVMKLRLPINVYLQAGVSDADVLPTFWPEDEEGFPLPFRIFDGYTTGSGYRKSSTTAEFVLFATHWLEDLNFSSATSRLFQPLNPQQFSFIQTIPDFITGKNVNMIGTTAAHDRFSPDVVINDLWGYNAPQVIPGTPVAGGIKTWFTQLATADLITAAEIKARGVIDSGANFEALNALARFEPTVPEGETPLEEILAIIGQLIDSEQPIADYLVSVGVPEEAAAAADELLAAGITSSEVLAYVLPFAKVGIPVYTDGVPLALAGIETFSQQVADQISDAIASETFYQVASQTMWDKLVADYGPNYMFSVVPMVEKALVVPFIPGLRTEYKTILGTEYDNISMNMDMPRMIRAVALVLGVSDTAGGFIERNFLPYRSIGGWYQGRDSGTIIFKSAPYWLANVALPYLDSYPSFGIGDIKSSALTAAGAAFDPINYAVKRGNAKILQDSYAQTLYMLEILRSRHAQLSGKLRFDIAPGSTVKIECAEDPFVGLDQSMYASVIRVSTHISAEAQVAGTAFHLSYVRSEVENIDNATSIAGPPLWQNVWKGAPLISGM